MERLTERRYHGVDFYMKCSENCNVDMDCIDCPAFEKLVDRLGAYEDTGLEPEEIRAYRAFFEDLIGNQKASEALDYFRSLAQADKEGRVLVLPVPMETTLYSIFAATHHLLKEGESPISEIEMGEHNAFSVCRHFGETIFLTREDAEQALERLRDDAVD